MALDLLQKFLGGDSQRQQDYSDFNQRYQNDPNSISDEEAARRYRELIKNAPPSAVAEANQHALEQLPEEQRQQMAEQFQKAQQDPQRPFDGYTYQNNQEAAQPGNLGSMMGQASQQDPDLLEQLIGKDSPLNSTLGRAALAAGAAYLASRVLGGQAQGGGGGGLGGLGGLLGGLGGNSQQDSGRIYNGDPNDFEGGRRV